MNKERMKEQGTREGTTFLQYGTTENHICVSETACRVILCTRAFAKGSCLSCETTKKL